MITRRTWGTYEVLAEGRNWKLKRLIVDPQSASSMQRHFKRCEIWFYPDVNSWRFINREEWHQLRNHSLEPLEIIELWMGDSSEGDIERIEV